MSYRHPHQRDPSAGDPNAPCEDKLVEQLTDFDQQLASDSADETQQVGDTKQSPARRLQRGKQALRVLEAIRFADPLALVGDHSQSRVEDDVAVGRGAPLLSLSSPDIDLPAKIGRFEIIRQLGEGGQGFVLLARDPQLKRQVALKVPRPEMLMTPDMRARFLREAETAAALNHPNIVPIYEQGTIGPICYIAAAFCDGESLQEWARQTPPSPLLAAQMIAVLADAVQHAHSRGVLHRDIKPSNVLLDMTQRESAETDAKAFCRTLRLTDFGLARLSSADGMTKSHAVIGTPAFMAPEQASGKASAVKEAADIYALGATLYWLLTGEPPLVGESDTATLNAIQNVDPQRPSSANREVPRDLDAVCLKCLEKQPERRYHSAAELATDLQRFIEGIPVVARQITPAIRFRRWCRRNPLLAAAIAAIMAILLSSIVWINHERGLALQSAEEAQIAKIAADENLAQSNQFFDSWRASTERMVHRATQELNEVPAAQDVRRQMLSDLMNITRQMSTARPDDWRLKVDLVERMTDVAKLTAQQGDFESSEELALEAALISEEVFDTVPWDGEPNEMPDRQRTALELLTESYNFAAYVRDRLHREEGALEMARRALDAWENADPALLTDKHRISILNNRMLCAHLLGRTGQPAACEALYRTNLEDYRKLAAARPDDHDLKNRWAGCHNNLANLLRHKLGRPDEALVLYPSAIALWEEALRLSPGTSVYRDWFGNGLQSYGGALEGAAGEKLLRRAIELKTELAKDFPNRPDYAFQAATIWSDLAKRQAQTDPSAARDSYEACRALMEPLVHRFSDRVRYQELFNQTQQALADRDEPSSSRD